ncbi:MAG: hypothetical protein M3Z01_06500 [Thermoproteota archaeon]|nr:hypothetical protein [Thermoproteota archaeon]
MLRQKHISNKTLAYGLFVVLISGITLSIDNILTENNKIQAQQQQQQQQIRSSIPHNAKGHESHQIVNFQNSSDSKNYKGTVIFNSSKHVDIISYKEMTGQQNTNTTTKVWEVGNKKFIPKTLLKNVTKGTVDFEGSGILAHSAQSNPYNVTFTINATSVNSTGGSISLTPLLKIFK